MKVPIRVHPLLDGRECSVMWTVYVRMQSEIRVLVELLDLTAEALATLMVHSIFVTTVRLITRHILSKEHSKLLKNPRV